MCLNGTCVSLCAPLKQSDKDLSYHVNDEMFDDETVAV